MSQGVRTTQGSPIYADHVPARSDILVEHLEAQGGIVYAKSNTPEFGAGANTFNEVFGAHAQSLEHCRARPPARPAAPRWRWPPAWPGWRTAPTWAARCATRRASAASSACGRASAASPHTLAAARSTARSASKGPMARNVEDLALLLDAMAGEHPADPLSLPAPATLVPRRRALRLQAEARRLFSPISASRRSIPEVARDHRARRRSASPRPASSSRRRIPISREAHECFQVLRAFDFAIEQGGAAAQHIATSSSPR